MSDMVTEKRMTDSEIIDSLGGTGAVATMFGIEPGSVSEWRTKGIPNARKQTLALMYPNKVPKSWAPKKSKAA